MASHLILENPGKQFTVDSIAVRFFECKTNPDLHSSTTVLDCWCEVFYCHTVFGFYQMWCLWPNKVELWSDLSKWYCSRNLVICLVATLEAEAVLTCPF